ncbi:hypothetical protein ABZ445_35000 [Streptomyces chartreusis]|uniref:hypothetical protein n=1 Tax=Streptomyces chartreusis TaxID=1969 RepID=UPI0033D15B1D
MCVVPSGAVQWIFANARPLVVRVDVVVLGTSPTSSARAGCRSARCRSNTSSAARAVTRPAAVPPTTTTVQTASTTQASTMSSRRRNGLLRHRHNHLFVHVPLPIVRTSKGWFTAQTVPARAPQPHGPTGRIGMADRYRVVVRVGRVVRPPARPRTVHRGTKRD